MVRNVVKLIVIRKTRVKSRRGGFAKPEVVVYFGLLWEKSTVGVAESEKRVAAIFLLPVWPLEPPGTLFFALFWRPRLDVVHPVGYLKISLLQIYY